MMITNELARESAIKLLVELRGYAALHLKDADNERYNSESRAVSRGLALGYSISADGVETLIHLMGEGEK
jgi:hypothetical protein